LDVQVLCLIVFMETSTIAHHHSGQIRRNG
jgi:hypothetical protein